MRFNYLIFFSILLFYGISAFAAPALVLEDNQAVYSLKEHGVIFYNTQNESVSFNEVSKEHIWVKASDIKQKPMISTYSKWLKVEIKNNSDHADWYLSFGYARLPSLKIYDVSGEYLKLEFEHSAIKSFYDRPVSDPILFIPLNFQSGSSKTLLIEYKTFANAPANVRLHNYQDYLATSQQSTLVNGAIAGVVMAILLIICVNLFFNTNKTNIYYALWTFTFLLIVMDMAGFTSKYIWPHLLGESSQFSILLMTTVPIFHLLFIDSFLQLRKFNVLAHRIYSLVLYIYVLLVPVALWFETVFFNLVLSTLIIPLFLYTSYWSWFQKAPGIRVFSLSLFNHVLFLNILTIVGASFGNVFPVFALSDYIKVGYLIEVSLFTVALAVQNKSVQNQLVSYLQEQVDSLNENLSAEKQLQATNIKAVQQKEEKLFADLSHELRTPLTVMKIQVESLQHNIVDNVHSSYGKLMKKINELNEFIDDLTQVTPSGKVYKNSNIKTQRVKDIINATYDIEIDKSLLNIERPELLSYSPSNLQRLIDYDSEGFKIVLEECCQNAISHGGNYVRISVHLDSDEDSLIVSIDNSGDSLNDDVFEQIFNPLVRLDDARNSEGNHKGVGLSLCKRIIESCNGEIFASNSELGGLGIHIIFPLKV